MAIHVLEGTWEEIAEHGGELSGKRVRLTILDDPCAENGNPLGGETKNQTGDLAPLIAAIDSRQPSSEPRRKRSPYSEAVVEKFRRQGLKLP